MSLPGLETPPGLIAPGGGDAPLYIRATKVQTDLTTTITLPAEINAGEIIVIVVVRRRANSTSGGPAATPSGYTLGASAHNNEGSHAKSIAIFVKRADGTEGGTDVTCAVTTGSTTLVKKAYIIAGPSAASITVGGKVTDDAFLPSGLTSYTITASSSSGPTIVFGVATPQDDTARQTSMAPQTGSDSHQNDTGSASMTIRYHFFDDGPSNVVFSVDANSATLAWVFCGCYIKLSDGEPNDPPSFTSSASFSADENQTAVGTVSAIDPDGDAVVYSIVGGADAAKFNINSTTGALSFITAPDFEQPGDADGDNVYDVVIRASDGINHVSQTVAVTVNDIDEETQLPETLSLFEALTPTDVSVVDDGQPVELGMRFTTDRDGLITEIKYFRAAADANDTDVRQGHLWGPDGTLLATTTFNSAPGQHGWQVATLNAPVAITAGLEYVVSYRTDNNFVVTFDFFTPGNEVAFDGLDNDAFSDPFGVLHAPQDAAGVYAYGSSPIKPDQTWQGANYWVDVTFKVNL